MPTERIDFWKGFIVGTLAGMAVAIFSNWDRSFDSELKNELEGRPIQEKVPSIRLSNTA